VSSAWLTHKSFRRRVFPDNRLHWYWRPNSKKAKKIHKEIKLTLIRTNWLYLKIHNNLYLNQQTLVYLQKQLM